MKNRQWFLVPFLALGLAAPAAAQTESLRVIACDTSVAPREALTILDEAGGDGAMVEDVALITLPNGMRSVQFSVRNAKAPNPFGTILKVRYSVQWTDDCGRRVTNGAQVVDGLALDPRQQRLVQSTALDPYATHAVLRIYVEN
uniref:hypothetical protein n=1 Tax=Castellaniella defragrans TaxID=75697 RepID=UPI00333E20BE